MRTDGSEMAYPVVFPHAEADYSRGLTKREYFSAMAMQGLCVSYPTKDISGWHAEHFASVSVGMADALISALNASKEESK